MQAMAEVKQSQMSAHLLHRGIARDQLTQATAIHVLDARQVDDQLAGIGIDDPRDTLSELFISSDDEVAVEVQNGDIVERPLGDVHLFSLVQYWERERPAVPGSGL